MGVMKRMPIVYIRPRTHIRSNEGAGDLLSFLLSK